MEQEQSGHGHQNDLARLAPPRSCADRPPLTPRCRALERLQRPRLALVGNECVASTGNASPGGSGVLRCPAAVSRPLATGHKMPANSHFCAEPAVLSAVAVEPRQIIGQAGSRPVDWLFMCRRLERFFGGLGVRGYTDSSVWEPPARLSTWGWFVVPDGYPNLAKRRAPFEVGNDFGRVHGGRVAVWKLQPRAQEIAEQLTELLPVRSPADAPTVDSLATVLVRLELLNDYLERNGLFDARGRPRPALKLLSSFENTAARLLAQLGCDPVSRAKLGLDTVRAGAALRAHLERNYGDKQADD